VPVRRRLLPLLAGALLLPGCGGGSDSKPAATTPARTAAVAPATGAPIRGTGYELRAAKGWNDVKQQLSQGSDVILATQSGSVMNVLREKVSGSSGRSVVLAALTRTVLSGASAKQLSASRPTSLDGAEGVTFRVRLKSDVGQTSGRVVIVIHSGYAYAIAASTSPAEPVSTDRAFASMLSSWHWT
jgi:hypothetical protein